MKIKNKKLHKNVNNTNQDISHMWFILQKIFNYINKILLNNELDYIIFLSYT